MELNPSIADVAEPTRNAQGATSRFAAAGLPLLIAVAALGGAVMNVILPLLPTLQVEFGADYRQVKSALTIFLVGAALAQLTMGPLSDAHGRRPWLLAALAVFCAGAVMSAVAPSLAMLDLGRLLQGFGGAGSFVLAQAIVFEDSETKTAPQRIGYLSASIAVGIMVAPVAGAIVSAGLGWRAIFWLAFAAGALLLGVCQRRIAKAPPRPAGPALASAAANTATLLRSRPFVGHALCAGLVMANYFCLAAFGPLIAISVLGLDKIEYGLLFAVLGAGYVGGNLASARLGERIGRRKAAAGALALGVVAGLAGAVLLGAGAMGPTAFLVVGCVMAMVTGLVRPGATNAARAASSSSTGAAAGLLNFAIYGTGAAVTAGVGFGLDPSGIAAMAALPVVTVAALLAGLWAARGTTEM